MGDNEKIYCIDNVIEGHRDYNKLKNIYKDLKKWVLRKKPLQKSDRRFVTAMEGRRTNPIYLKGITMQNPAWREGGYGWELYHIGSGNIMVEFFDEGEVNARDALVSLDPEEAKMYFMKITLHPSEESIESVIEEILEKYPREEKK